LEKAWAKLHGSYKRIEAGEAHKTFRDILGAPAWEYKSNDPKIDAFDAILAADEENFIMTAGCAPTTNE